MPTKPMSRCTNCKTLHSGTGKCDDCRDKARAESDARRGTSYQRGYGKQHTDRFRIGVLGKNPHCVCTASYCPHTKECGRLSTVADHFPLSRRDLVARGMDPDNPAYGRGLCEPCHDRHTAHAQPGGWNKR